LHKWHLNAHWCIFLALQYCPDAGVASRITETWVLTPSLQHNIGLPWGQHNLLPFSNCNYFIHWHFLLIIQHFSSTNPSIQHFCLPSVPLVHWSTSTSQPCISFVGSSHQFCILKFYGHSTIYFLAYILNFLSPHFKVLVWLNVITSTLTFLLNS
jgi:hypothetical protein